MKREFTGSSWVFDGGYRFARYADDFVVLRQTSQQAQEALRLVKQVLENELGLKTNRVAQRPPGIDATPLV